MEFHISRAIRERLNLDATLFRYTGNVVFGNVAASRKLAKQLNDVHSLEADPDENVNAGALFAMGLIDELSHALIATYRRETDPAILSDGLRWFADLFTQPELDRLLLVFTEQFPSVAVYRGELTAAEWLEQSTDGFPNREAALEELLLLWIANINPAFAPFRELFLDGILRDGTKYLGVTSALEGYFETRPLVDPQAGTLFEALCAPINASPDSLKGQLDYIRTQWTKQLGPELTRVLLAIDVMREEDIAVWMRFHPPGQDRHTESTAGQGPEGFQGDEFVGYDDSFDIGPDGTRQRRYSADYQAPLHEYEAFSADQAWMPNVVMMAKSTYVWLEQLSQRYERHIHRLDQIPDEELQTLADRGITALWLIGLWERSTASRTIKRLRGHSDAVASAYSLKEYKIAEDLAGNTGYEVLRDRAARFGIRLASDMVPNHMGIDSNWVIEHPEWFLSRWETPFPVYTFNGPDLSTDSRVEIKIEDHYYDQTDAAVAFRIHYHGDDSTRFIYHGNDGTTFAWNDTAQLDYSKAAVREHVIQTILYVAKLFPIIRFDAAMVLAKRHVQRLWFPLPGAGGAIPSRAEDAMSQEAFDALMPHEFWREVVDRVAIEVPGTLLLAEAFWLLEGYFVRTLGMHRVYNSAFMNMLRDEENAKYRSYLKKTIEFDPDILKRYVNFMSNPDERTAVDQFGDGDKYFGCCTLLATLPGLPMFAHGQVEGFTERYGMEFKQAKMRETPSAGLIARHQHEIAPLLKQRHIFAESTNFLLYDFWTGQGQVNENVFAYSNRSDDQRSLIIYNNSYTSTQGTIHVSAASTDKASGQMRERSLIDGLAFSEHDQVLRYRDSISGLEYLRRSQDIRMYGLSFQLRGYQYSVLIGWHVVSPTQENPWNALCDQLGGAGVPDLNAAVSRLRLRPLVTAIERALTHEAVSALHNFSIAQSPSVSLDEDPGNPSVSIEKTQALSQEAVELVGSAALTADIRDTRLDSFVEQAAAFYDELIGSMPSSLLQQLTTSMLYSEKPASSPTRFSENQDGLPSSRGGSERESYIARLGTSVDDLVQLCKLQSFSQIISAEAWWAPLLAWTMLRSLPSQWSKTAIFDSLELRSAFSEAFSSVDITGEQTWRCAAQVRVLLLLEEVAGGDLHSPTLWSDADVRWLAGVNEAHAEIYVSKEQFENLVTWMQIPAILQHSRNEIASTRNMTALVSDLADEKQSMITANFRLGSWMQARKARPRATAGQMRLPVPPSPFSEAAEPAPSGKSSR